MKGRINISIDPALHQAALIWLEKKNHANFSAYITYLVARDMGLPMPGDDEDLRLALMTALKESATDLEIKPASRSRSKKTSRA